MKNESRQLSVPKMPSWQAVQANSIFAVLPVHLSLLRNAESRRRSSALGVIGVACQYGIFGRDNFKDGLLKQFDLASAAGLRLFSGNLRSGDGRRIKLARPVQPWPDGHSTSWRGSGRGCTVDRVRRSRSNAALTENAILASGQSEFHLWRLAYPSPIEPRISVLTADHCPHGLALSDELSNERRTSSMSCRPPNRSKAFSSRCKSSSERLCRLTMPRCVFSEARSNSSILS